MAARRAILWRLAQTARTAAWAEQRAQSGRKPAAGRTAAASFPRRERLGEQQPPELRPRRAGAPVAARRAVRPAFRRRPAPARAWGPHRVRTVGLRVSSSWWVLRLMRAQ